MTAPLPHSEESERGLVGWCLVSPGQAWKVLDRLSPDDFYRPLWANAIDVLRSQHSTAAQVADKLGLDHEQRGDLISAMTQGTESWHLDATIDAVAELASRRRVIVAAREAQTMAQDTTTDLADAQDSLRGALDELERPNASAVTEADEFLVSDDDPYDWVIPDLLERGDRMLITAGEGIGKSVLLRQMAVMTAAGIHPFRQSNMPAKRVLLVDVENMVRKVRRELRPLVARVEGQWNPGNLGIEVRVGGMDLANSADVRWLAGKVAAHKPDMLVIGPLYQLHGAAGKGDTGGENHARNLARTLDRIRERFGCALLMETHAPHAQAGGRDLRPFGSSVWLRWPEFGVGLQRNKDRGDKTFDFKHWRGPRDRRDFPVALEYGGPNSWPWIAVYSDREGQW